MSGSRGGPAAPTLEIVVRSPLWKAEPGAVAAVRRAIKEAIAVVSTRSGELAIVLTDDSSIRALNRQWRGKDEPTNVLSFPAAEPQYGAPVLLGDIVIAYETTAREASAEHKPFMHHLAHLAVHGFLHLLGYDHEAKAEARVMERLETAILARLAVPDPYMLRDAKN